MGQEVSNDNKEKIRPPQGLLFRGGKCVGYWPSTTNPFVAKVYFKAENERGK